MDATLVMFGKNGRRRDIAIKAGLTVLGRRPDCDVRIPLPLVSRKHCRISRGDDGLTIQDLGSANGTFVNNRKVTETEIKAGDLIRVGPMRFVIQVNGLPKNISVPEQSSTEKKAFGSSMMQLSGSHVSTGHKPVEDSLSELDPGADAGLDDSFS